MRRTADPMLEKNREYTKLRSKQETPKAPRERPHDQTPGVTGHRKPDYEQWTIEELRALAAELGDDEATRRPRRELIEYLEAHARRAGEAP